MKALCLILGLAVVQAMAGEVYVQWSLPDINDHGEPLAPGELQRIEVVYWRGGNEAAAETIDAGLAETIRISGLKPGPWHFYAVAISHCLVATPGGQLSNYECKSDKTATQRVQVKK